MSYILHSTSVSDEFNHCYPLTCRNEPSARYSRQKNTELASQIRMYSPASTGENNQNRT